MLIRNKLTLLFTGIVLAIQVAFTSFVYTFYSVSREQEFYTRLQGKARLFGRVMISRHPVQDVLNRALSPADLQTLTEEHISIYDHRDTLLFANQAVAYYRREARMLPVLHRNPLVKFEIGHDEGIGVVYMDQQRPYYIFVTGYDRLGRSKQQNLFMILLVANVGGFLLIVVAGWYVVGLFLRPLSRIVSEVRQISGTHLHLRLHEGNRKDEIAGLAMTFNQMLTQLQATFESQRQFVSHASHELRTPLTTVLGTLETSLRYDTDPADWRASMQVSMNELTKLVALTNSLLKLASAGDGSLGMSPIRLDECVMAAISQVKGRRTGCAVNFQFGDLPESDFFVVSGNEPLLTTALLNIIDNACKYAHEAVRVELYTNARDSIYSIDIVDQGVGISADDLPHVFEPLYRGQNASRAEGFGVGLAITQQVIQLHQGIISIRSTPGQGTCVTIELPAHGSETAAAPADNASVH